MVTFRLAFLNVQAAEDALPRIVDIMATQLQWSKTEKNVNILCVVLSWFLHYAVGPDGVC